MKNALIVILVLLSGVLFIKILSSDASHEEKVVIIDSPLTTSTERPYKVLRLSNRTVTWIKIDWQERYESGDTILHKF